MPERSSGRRPAALVMGGGMTGMLAAAVLSEHADVTVVESDVLPRLPAPRKGLPQARHAHLLWSGGVRALEDLLPGITDQLIGRGARRVPIMSGMVSKAPSGQWFRRFDDAHHHSLVCSRDLLDSTIRTEVLRLPRVTLRERTELIALEGDSDRVTGVRTHDAAGDGTLSADLVVDATGRASRAPVWLTDLGLPPVEERVVDAGVGYASRIYRAPASTGVDFPIVNVQADPRQPPGRGGIILPVEEGRWLVTLSGTRGGRPSRDNDEFVSFARSLAHPVIGDLLTGAEPLTDVVTTHSTANKRRYFEKSPSWPAGFAVLGDAVAGYNPVYGHGLTAAAQSVLALKRVLARHALDSPETAVRIQRRAALPVGQAWDLAVGQDILYPGATDGAPSRLERVAAGYIDRAVDAGARNPHALRVLLDVMSMERTPARLLAPDMLFRVFLGRKEPLLDGPPLTEDERKAAGL
ncbi:FAD-dependent monooxygenase [Streptomyces sp. NPDC021080]|uniref:FAD-dependent monooxygenase n=1 Tax=Streptomyces sp. NPDC021080 TaxID=3365110 RepID=UPI0037B5DB10